MFDVEDSFIKIKLLTIKITFKIRKQLEVAIQVVDESTFIF